jgi:hypothetical protein
LGVTSLNVFGFLGFGGTAKWKEEVLLHDGAKLIVERSQAYGGYSEPASRERQLVEETWEFVVPDTSKKVFWKNTFGKTPESSNLMLLILDFINGTPFLAANPAGCNSYNTWKRPNPPYVFFKFVGKEWQQITLNEFPDELLDTNVVVGRPDPQNRIGTLTIATIKEENRNLEPYLRIISRKPLDGVGCKKLIFYKGSWISPEGTFGRKFIDRTTK